MIIIFMHWHSFLKLYPLTRAHEGLRQTIQWLFSTVYVLLWKVSMHDNNRNHLPVGVPASSTNRALSVISFNGCRPKSQIATASVDLPRPYIPDTDMTVDEQLVPYHGRYPFRQYMNSKLAKYGIKIWWNCNAISSYPLNGQVYHDTSMTTPCSYCEQLKPNLKTLKSLKSFKDAIDSISAAINTMQSTLTHAEIIGGKRFGKWCICVMTTLYMVILLCIVSL